MNINKEDMNIEVDMTGFVEPRRRKKRSAADNRPKVEVITGVVDEMQSEWASKWEPTGEDSEQRVVTVPKDRYIPLKANWMKIFTPIVEHMQLHIRFNMKARTVELRMAPETPDIKNLQKGADFVQAFIYGFGVEDAMNLLRFDDLFMETFEIEDVKRSLKGDHLSRAIGRLAGKDGLTKLAIENSTVTSVVFVENKVHILGTFDSIALARRAISNLILGRKPPSKVHGQLRNMARRLNR
ncbi:RNA-binding protein pno1-like [Ceratina calcarata]|uniref:RNA-binding protein pno1-like n=1 Tax=Ceratina calcarata TaxID=156304 RepID=A0AAJ7N3K7_9HYME|nr:RNA-binding protein pno1-like [Ceratina calcarata]